MPTENARDPREVLARQKYFSLRPKPLEQWLWKQGAPPSAERVFWLHWQEGMISGDWCSEIPLKRVAAQCSLDISSVTRAYQHLAKLGLIRRQDPGRDPARPFEQAVAITEVRVPRELLQEMDRHPNRSSGVTAMGLGTAAAANHKPNPEPTSTTQIEAAQPADPFAGLQGRERMKALSQLLHTLSAGEQRAYHEAILQRLGHMSFEAETQVPAEARGKILQFLSVLALNPTAAPVVAPSTQAPRIATGPRKLSVFELARLKRDIQGITSSASTPELTRQVVWSIEEGGLRRFPPVHAIHIALKKIREGGWTRPNRMPPNWARAISAAAAPETCRRA